ncbi:PepSY domain-containing protein [Sedimenticola sp.]|uniref:PepSY domain-containing protein n=1 Tax=Sedimenticola sp. TaxID=1940285 RepID=UPI003D103BA7
MVLVSRRRLLAGVLWSCLLFCLPVMVQQYNHTGVRADSQKGRGGVDLDTTVERIRKQTGGRVLHAETLNNQGNREHHVRIITDRGTVKRYRVDAGSGEDVSPGHNRR